MEGAYVISIADERSVQQDNELDIPSYVLKLHPCSTFLTACYSQESRVGEGLGTKLCHAQQVLLSYLSYFILKFQNHSSTQLPIPWLKMLTSPAVWGVLIAGLCNTWNLYVLITCMPSYFKQTLSDLQANERVSPDKA